jgi:hypothetical protein
MNSDQHGRWFQSRLFPWVTGQPLDVDLTFLAGARHFAAPEVAEMVLVFTGTVTPAVGTAQGEDFCKLFGNVAFRDEAEMINASGNMLRLLAMMELGSKYVDPADIGVGVPTAVTYRLPIMFEPLDTRAIRPRDFRVPLAHFLEGGNLVVNLANALPTNFGAVAGDWNIQVFFRVVDGRVRELKSRRRIWEQAVALQEFSYQVGGSLRSAILGSNLTTTGYTSLATFTTVYSKTLDLPPSFATHILVDQYRRSSDALGAGDEFTIAAPGGIPLVTPNRGKKIGQMIDTPLLHLDLLRAAPASGRILMDAVVDRTPNMAALAAGYGSPEELANAIMARGKVVGEAGNYPAKNMPRNLARRMCIRV